MNIELNINNIIIFIMPGRIEYNYPSRWSRWNINFDYRMIAGAIVLISLCHL